MEYIAKHLEIRSQDGIVRRMKVTCTQDQFIDNIVIPAQAACSDIVEIDEIEYKKGALLENEYSLSFEDDPKLVIGRGYTIGGSEEFDMSLAVMMPWYARWSPFTLISITVATSVIISTLLTIVILS